MSRKCHGRYKFFLAVSVCVFVHYPFTFPRGNQIFESMGGREYLIIYAKLLRGRIIYTWSLVVYHKHTYKSHTPRSISSAVQRWIQVHEVVGPTPGTCFQITKTYLFIGLPFKVYPVIPFPLKPQKVCVVT